MIKKNHSKWVTFRFIKTDLKIKSANIINISIIVVSLLKQLIYIYIIQMFVKLLLS